MNWEAIGAVGEVVGAVAVVATLGYLAVQIRQNTKMMKSSMRQQLARASQDGLIQFAEHAGILSKIFVEKDTAWSSPAEAMEAELLVTAFFRNWENHAWQHRQGLVDTEEWNGIVEDIRFRATFPYIVEQWHQTRTRFSRTLQETLDPVFGTGEQRDQ